MRKMFKIAEIMMVTLLVFALATPAMAGWSDTDITSITDVVTGSATGIVVDGTITADNIATTTDTKAGDLAIATNLTVGGTAAVTGVATFTAESVHNLGIDADKITVDAGEGVDTKTAGTLEIGVLTANQINVGITAVETDILGTLNVTEAASFDAAVVADTTLEVTGVATLTSAPVFVAVTASGSAAALLTNAPAITEETPTWITVTIGGNDFVIAAWDLD